MIIPKAIKSAPYPKYEGISLAHFQVTGYYHDSDSGQMLVLTFIGNPKPPQRWRSTINSFRLIIPRTQHDFAVVPKDKNRAIRVTLARALGGFSAISSYPDIDPQTEKMIKAYIGDKGTCNHHMDNLNDYMEEVINERREAARLAAGNIDDDAVAACPAELPAGLLDWIHREIMPYDNTIIYKPGGKRGVCALCHASVRMSADKKMRQGTYIECPVCGQEVLCVLSKSSAWRADYVDNIVAVQRGADGSVWFRQWHILRDDSAQYDGGMERHIAEVARYAIRGNKTAMWVKEGKMPTLGRALVYKRQQWTRSNRLFTYDGAYHFYEGGLDDAVKGTSLAYADLHGYLSAELTGRNVIKYAQDFARYPVMEFLWKAGFYGIVSEKVKGINREHANAILWKRKKLNECIRFPLRYLKFKAPAEWTIADMHRLRNICERDNLSDKERQLLLLSRIRDDNLQSVCQYASAAKTLAYLEKQSQPSEERPYAVSIADTARSYCDYIGECEKLQLDLTQSQVLFPPGLEAAHARTMRMVSYESNRLLAEKLEKQVQRLLKYAWEYNGLMIYPAATAEELKQEGAALHHCVGGYVDRVAEGKTAIFFIRSANAPNTPFYTLELQNKSVIQCRTIDNKPYDGDIKAFVDEWLKQVVAAGGCKPQQVKIQAAV